MILSIFPIKTLFGKGDFHPVVVFFGESHGITELLGMAVVLAIEKIIAIRVEGHTVLEQGDCGQKPFPTAFLLGNIIVI